MTGQLTIPSGKTLNVTAATTTTLSCDVNQGGTLIGAPGSSLVLNGTQPQTLGGTNTLRSLTINNPSGVTLSNNLNIQNALTLTSGIFDIGSNTLDITGTITRNSGSINASGASATVNFSGVIAQTIPANAFSGRITNLGINNLSGVTINSNLAVANLLTLTNGKLILGNFNLTTSSVSGANATNYIQTNGMGRLRLGINNTAALNFPVGNTFYNPVQVTNNSGSSDTFAVRVLNEVLSGGVLGVTVTIPRISATWDVSKSLPNGGQGFNMLFSWQPVQNLGVLSPVLLNYHGAWVNQTGTLSTPFSNSLAYINYSGSDPLFAISDNAVVLPLTWLSFTAAKQGNKVLLDWTTGAEINVRDFIVERNNGDNHWIVIGSLDAKNGFDKNVYRFTDDKPLPGNGYYRIKENDADGKFSYSVIKSMSGAFDSKRMIVVNPVTNGRLVFTLFEESEISLTENNGRQVWKKNFAEGKQQVNVGSLPSGVYILSSKEGSMKILIRNK